MSAREDRIRRRREIIQKRCSENATKGDQDDKDSTTSESIEKDSNNECLKSEQQIAESLSQLKRRKDNHIQDATSIRVKVDREENVRRIERESYRSKINEKAKAVLKQNLNIDGSTKIDWDALDPGTVELKEIYNNMEKIKNNYDEILAEKDCLIEEFRLELKQQDQLYLESLKNQEETIDRTREMTSKQISAIKTFCDDELKAIDESFQEDRRHLIQEHAAHLKSLAAKKRSAADESLRAASDRKDEKEKKILDAHDAVNAEYNALRDKLQDQVAQLEREWSVSRGLYLVSADQIDYDHREIETKNSESEQKIKRNKKRIIQFKEELNRELDKTKTTEQKETKKNDSLELDCRRLEGQYRNLLSKLHRFEVSEDQKYYSALSMHKEEATTLSDRIRKVKDEIMGLFDVRYTESAGETLSSIDEKNDPAIDCSGGDTKQQFSWDQLENIIVRYHDLLEKRTRTLKNVSHISEQNSSLERQLDANLKDDINKSLIVPPLSY